MLLLVCASSVATSSKQHQIETQGYGAAKYRIIDTGSSGFGAKDRILVLTQMESFKRTPLYLFRETGAKKPIHTPADVALRLHFVIRHDRYIVQRVFALT